MSERFFDELTELLEVVATFRSQVIVTGDFNVHSNRPTDRRASRLAELLTTLDMQQAVTQPTNTGGNTLDLVITRPEGRRTNCSVAPAARHLRSFLDRLRLPVHSVRRSTGYTDLSTVEEDGLT